MTAIETERNDVQAGPVDADTLFDPGAPILRLSFSRVDTYQQCPLKFRYAYVERQPTVPSPHLSWGTSVHAALEVWWSEKLPVAPPVDVLLQALYDRWDDSGFEGMPREDKIRWYRHAQDVLRRHHQLYADRYAPAVASEQRFSVMIDDVEVVGCIDHVVRADDGRLGIVDWKTNKRAKTRQQVRDSLQLAVYVLAAEELWGQEPAWVALDFVVPGLRVTVPREDIDTDRARRVIKEVAARIRSEAFPPTPSRLCGWCDFRALCPAFDGDGPDVPGLAIAELARLRRRQARDAARIAELEGLVRARLGENALVEIGALNT